MKKMRILSLAFALILIVPLFATVASADADWAELTYFDAVDEPMPEGNLLSNGAFDSTVTGLTGWNPGTKTLTQVMRDNGGFLHLSNIPGPLSSFDFSQDTKKSVAAGNYKFTGYFRMAYEGEVTGLRIYLYDKNHGKNTRDGAAMAYIYPTNSEWLKVEFYVTFDSDFTGIRICGGPYNEFYQSYCIDNFSLVKVDSIPAGYKRPTAFGTKVTKEQALASNNGSGDYFAAWDEEFESQYEVQGIMVNRDPDFIGTCSATTTAADLRKYIDGYKDTHVTDFMIQVYSQVAVYPSEVGTDFLDQYHYNKKNGYEITNNQQMAYIMFERKKLDYIEVFCEEFPEIGINPWLSFRMNDAHRVQNPSDVKIWDFFTQNPQYRRVQHGSTVNSYYNNILDYTHEGVRDHMLDIINESLDRYDCYGIELDFQREMWIWHHGGEYNGLDILTDFMRKVNGVVAVYEKKYGHDIKVAVRCASDIQTNYDLGYDVITWAAEGLMDLVNPTSRWATTDFDIPARMWAAVMHPYGVEVAPGIESLLNLGPHNTVGAKLTYENVCALAANWFSQGADKIYLYNRFLSLPTALTEENYITTDKNTLDIGSGNGHFNMLTTIGSYEKSVNRNRRMLLTCNDIIPMWKTSNGQLTFSVGPNKTGMLRIPMGDVPEGSVITFNFSANSLNLKNRPTVIINGKTAECTGSFADPSNSFTSDKQLSYIVPESAHDDGYIYIEITPQKYLSMVYADIHIEVPKN